MIRQTHTRAPVLIVWHRRIIVGAIRAIVFVSDTSGWNAKCALRAEAKTIRRRGEHDMTRSVPANR